MDGIVGSNTWNSLCGPIVSGLLAKKLVVLANKEVGVKEVPLYSNRGPRVDQYRAATNLALGMDGWEWCAAFICWLMREAMAKGEYGFSRPQEAGVSNFERNWAVKQKCGISLKKPHNNDIIAGDIVVFTWSHIGLATSAPDASSNINTIEGNSRADGSANKNGDGVHAKKRKLSEIKSRIRITESDCTAAATEAQLSMQDK